MHALAPLSLTAYEALRLLEAKGNPTLSEHRLKREVGEALGLIVFDESSVERGADAEIEELARFDDADEAFEPEFQRAMDELAATGLVQRALAPPGGSPKAWIPDNNRRLRARQRVQDLLALGPKETALSRGPRERLSSLAGT